MKRYVTAAGLVLTGLLALFLIVEALDVPLLMDPTPWLERGGPVAALVGVLLLTVDVLLPGPLNVVMLANGALFGVAGGTLLSLVGSMGAASPDSGSGGAAARSSMPSCPRPSAGVPIACSRAGASPRSS